MGFFWNTELKYSVALFIEKFLSYLNFNFVELAIKFLALCFCETSRSDPSYSISLLYERTQQSCAWCFNILYDDVCTNSFLSISRWYVRFCKIALSMRPRKILHQYVYILISFIALEINIFHRQLKAVYCTIGECKLITIVIDLFVIKLILAVTNTFSNDPKNSLTTNIIKLLIL